MATDLCDLSLFATSPTNEYHVTRPAWLQADALPEDPVWAPARVASPARRARTPPAAAATPPLVTPPAEPSRCGCRGDRSGGTSVSRCIIDRLKRSFEASAAGATDAPSAAVRAVAVARATTVSPPPPPFPRADSPDAAREPPPAPPVVANPASSFTDRRQRRLRHLQQASTSSTASHPARSPTSPFFFPPPHRPPEPAAAAETLVLPAPRASAASSGAGPAGRALPMIWLDDEAMWLVADPTDPEYGSHAAPAPAAAVARAEHPAFRRNRHHQNRHHRDEWVDETLPTYEARPSPPPSRRPAPPASAALPAQPFPDVSAPPTPERPNSAPDSGRSSGGGPRWPGVTPPLAPGAGLSPHHPNHHRLGSPTDERLSGQFQEAISGFGLIPFGATATAAGGRGFGRSRDGSSASASSPSTASPARQYRRRRQGRQQQQKSEGTGIPRWPTAVDDERELRRERLQRWSADDVSPESSGGALSSGRGAGLLGEGLVSPLSPSESEPWRSSARR